MNVQQIAQRMIVELNDAKLVATSQDWLDWSLVLTQHLRDAGYHDAADQMRQTVTLDDFLGTCAEVVFDIYHDAF